MARLWMTELDYRQFKGEVGLDHYEGRSHLGFRRHCALLIAAHGSLTLERTERVSEGSGRRRRAQKRAAGHIDHVPPARQQKPPAKARACART